MPIVNSVNGLDGNLLLPRDLPDYLTAETVSAITPTITATQQATSTIVSAQALFSPTNNVFSYTAAMGFGAAFPDTTLYLPVSRYPNTYGNPPFWSVTFGTDAQVFEVLFKYISSATLYRLSIDGRKVTDLVTTTGGASAGSRYVLKFDLGSSAPRKIRFDFYTMPFGGIFIGPNDSIWKEPLVGDRLMAFGDSFTAGSAQNTGSGAGTWFSRFARIMGYEDHWNSSIGGTGYIADNSGASVALNARVATDVAPYAPKRMIVWAGYNDTSSAASAIDVAARTLYKTLTAATDSYIVVVGPATSNGTPTAGQLATAATLQQAAKDWKLPFIDPQTGAVYNADGTLLATTGAWITTANTSRFIGADNVHPNDLGHTYIARRMAEAYALIGNP